MRGQPCVTRKLPFRDRMGNFFLWKDKRRYEHYIHDIPQIDVHV